MKTIKDLNINNKKVIIRCDFNVPIKNGKIIDTNRIDEELKTINYCINNNAKVILLSHLGRIKTKEDLDKNDLEIVFKYLKTIYKNKIFFSNKTKGKELENIISNMNYGEIVLVQNTRYEDLEDKKESSNDNNLATYWASLGDIFINDAFGTLHRSHASNVGISSHLESAIGFLVEKELEHLNFLNNPEKPFTIILGGSKISDKIGVVEKLIKKADYLLIGGAMANTFLKANNINIYNSVYDIEKVEYAKELLDKYSDKIILPIDAKTSTDINSNTYIEKDVTNLEEKDLILDIGSKTVNLYKTYIDKSSSIFWNGPLGYYENDIFVEATIDLLNYLKDKDIKTIIGGGDTASIANKLKLNDKLYHISTGGGATLSYIEDNNLVGLKNI